MQQSQSVRCEISVGIELLNEQSGYYHPVYSLRRICAHGEFENIVTEVGQIR